jgi:hypothetical protein
MSGIITKNKKESLTTRLTLIIVGLTAGSGLLIPATYASFHPVTTGEIADDTIRSVDISNTAGVQSVDIVNGQVGSVDIGNGQVAAVDIVDNAIRPNVQEITGPSTLIQLGSIGASLAPCPAGTVLTGGGYLASAARAYVLRSGPSGENSWVATAFNDGRINNEDIRLVAYAICMGPMP